MPSKTNAQALEAAIERKLTGICREERDTQVPQGGLRLGETAVSYDVHRTHNGYFIGEPSAFDADFGGHCWLTQNTTGNSDVDDGAVRLISPLMDFAAGDRAL